MAFLFVMLGLPARGGHSLKQTLCHGLWINCDAVFDFFHKRVPFRCSIQFLFLSLDGATIFTKLRSKIAKSQKICANVCVHDFV